MEEVQVLERDCGSSDAVSLLCRRCSYMWAPKSPDRMPRNCPSCRSTVWMKESETKMCMRCGHGWMSTDETPKRCPSCGTYRWKDVPTIHRCLKCDYKWNAKRDWAPKRCPSCRTMTWAKREEMPGGAMIGGSRKMYSDMSMQNVESVVRYYNSGSTCTKISIFSGIPFSTVYDIVSDKCSDRPRV